MRISGAVSLCAVFVLVGVISADEKADEDVRQVALVSISGSLPESTGVAGMFGEIGSNLPNLLQRLQAAAKDEKLHGVLLKLRTPSIGRAKVAEIRAAIGRIRESGKVVVAQIESGESVDYLLAAACDEIVMPESGTLLLPGLRAEVTFYKGLFDKLGLQADMMQVGDFKGSAEPYTRKKMSPEFRAQFEQLLDDFFAQMVSTIATDRELEEQEVRRLIDIGLFTPSEALEAGLIDALAYDDELETRLKKTLGSDKLKFLKNYGRRKVEDDFSGMLGMMKLFEAILGGKPSKRASSKKKLAVVYASGTIMPGESGASLTGGVVLGGRTLVKALRQAEQDETVVATVLRVDSPGGSALASDLIWRAVQQSKKPVIASMGDTAASGGYYIAMGCDRIFAEPGTLTGSIGVLGGKIAVEGLFEKVGVATEVISRGKNSGILSIDSAFSGSERDAWKKMMQEVYRLFLTKAAKGRGMEVEQMTKLAGGRVWSGKRAVEVGLVDELGSLSDAIAAARSKAGMEDGEPIEILHLPKPVSFLDQLLGAQSGIGAVRIDMAGLPIARSRHWQHLLMMKELLKEPALLVMPQLISIR